jgi:signal transduction histidine kinase
LAIILAVAAGFSWYALQQIGKLEVLQSETIDRNRRSGLQLIRIQNDLNHLGLALRDMLDSGEPYPLSAWRTQLDRIRIDLEDALRREAESAPAARSPEQTRYLQESVRQFWMSVEQMFSMAEQGREELARRLIRTSLQAQQSSLANNVARLLVQNTEVEQEASERTREIYHGVRRNTYVLLMLILVTIALTGGYLIYSNRALFASLEALAEQKSDLARRLISVQEEVLRSVARELHDEFGQILTAIGAMLQRIDKKGLPADSPLREDLNEVREVAQRALEKTRSLSQALHPSILDDAGLEQAIDWYVKVFEKQTGIPVQYEKEGAIPEVRGNRAVNVYRVLQEALNNVAQHSQSAKACVRLHFQRPRLRLEIEDEGVGLTPAERRSRNGIGLIAMRERAALLGGKLEFERPARGGTRVRLEVPLEDHPDG